MAKVDINEFTLKKHLQTIRPTDPQILNQLDFGYTYDGKVILLFEIRPVWNKINEKQNIPYAKIKYYKTKKEWKLYWMRANGNWELYQPFPQSSNLQQILEVIKEDKHHCFFG